MDFDTAWKRTDAIPGWLSRAEAEELWRLANTTKGDIVEIGCHLGRASVLLGAAAPITCVDTFSRHGNGINQYDTWKHNIVGSGSSPNIDVIREGRAGETYHAWNSLIGLLFINETDKTKAIDMLAGWKQHLLDGAAVVVWNGDFSELKPYGCHTIEKQVGRLLTCRYTRP